MVLVKFEKYYSVYYQSIRNIKSFTEECHKQKLLVVDDDVWIAYKNTPDIAKGSAKDCWSSELPSVPIRWYNRLSTVQKMQCMNSNNHQCQWLSWLTDIFTEAELWLSFNSYRDRTIWGAILITASGGGGGNPRRAEGNQQCPVIKWRFWMGLWVKVKHDIPWVWHQERLD